MKTGVAIPPRVLVGLTVAVLAAHSWMLRSTAPRVQLREPARAPSFATRSIRAERPAAPQQILEPEARPVPARPEPARSTTAPGKSLGARKAPPGSAAKPSPPPSTVPTKPDRVSGPAPARFSVLASAQLNYVVQAQVRGQNRQGEARLLWHHDGDHYEARLETSSGAQPPRVQQSTGRITGQGLAPQRFSDKSRTEQATHFERESERLIFSNNRPAAPLLDGAQDRLSVMLQIAAMLAGEPHRYPPGTTIQVQTAGTHEAEPSLFTVQAEERLELPGGTLAAIKLDRPPRREFDQRMELWLAPGLDYAPVRLRLTQPNGDWVDQQWSSTDRR